MAESSKIPEVSFLRFLRHSANIVKNPLPFHLQNFQKHGDTFRLKIGINDSVIFSRDPKLAQYALQKNQRNFHKSTIQTEDLSKYVGKGLLTAEGDHWKRQRKLIQPAFHKKNIEQLLSTIQNAIDHSLKRMETGKSFDVFPIFNDLAFEVVVKSLFSNAANKEQIDRLQFITEEAQKMLVRELRQPYKGWWFELSGQIKRNVDLTDESRDILHSLVQQRKNSGKKYGDLLDMLLEARYDDGNFMDEDHLIDEILILFVAGHETTSNALSFMTQLLAHHQDWQDKLRAEAAGVDEFRPDLMKVISSASIAGQIIEESLRLYPPAYFIDRVNIEKDHFGQYEFEPGSNLLFSVYEMHRHPDYWERPEEFDPSRFEDQAGLKKYSSFYFPFGAGPRKCIGNNFAMYEMILVLLSLVRKYKIEPVKEEIEIKPLITLKPQNACVRFSRI